MVPVAQNEVIGGQSIVQDPVNQVIYIAGFLLNATDNTKSDAIILQTDLGGRRVWTRTFGSPAAGRNVAYKVILDTSPAGGVIVCGTYFEDAVAVLSGDQDVFVARYDLYGTLVHFGTAGGPGSDAVYDMVNVPGSPSLLAVGSYAQKRTIYEFSFANLTYQTMLMLGSGEFNAVYHHPATPTTLRLTGSSAYNSTMYASVFTYSIKTFNPIDTTEIYSYLFLPCPGYGRSLRYSSVNKLTVAAGICTGNTGLYMWINETSLSATAYLLGFQISNMEMFDDVVDPYVLTVLPGQESVLSMGVDVVYYRKYSYFPGSTKQFFDLSIDKVTGIGHALIYYPIGFKEIFANVTRPQKPYSATTTILSSTKIDVSTTTDSSYLLTSTTASLEIVTTATPIPTDTLPKNSSQKRSVNEPFISSETLIFILIGLVTFLVMTSFNYALYLTCIRKSAAVGVADCQSPIPSRPRAYTNPDSIVKSNASISQNSATMLDTSVTLGGVERGMPSNAGRQIFINADFQIEKRLVLGEDGMYLAKSLAQALKKHGEFVMLKTFQPLSDRSYDETFYAFQRELFMLQSMNGSRNIVQILGYSMMEPPSIVLKYYSHGNLKMWLTSRQHIKSKGFIFHLIKDIAYGLKTLFTAGVAHCNLNLESILIDEGEYGQLSCVISNFSCAETLQTLKQYPRYSVTSLMFTAPESILHSRNDKPPGKIQFPLLIKRDTFAFAALVCSLLSANINLRFDTG